MRGCIVRAFDGPHSLAVSIVWNLKICTTALALRCCLGRHLHWMQWLAIGALTCGVIISQEDKLEEGWAHPPALPSAAGASSPHPNRKLVGLLFCLASIASVTVANVLCEHLYKRPPKSAMSPLASMYSRNCSLYFFGVVCNLMALCFRSPPGGFSLWPSDWQLRDTFAHLFDGYNGFVAGPSADSRAWEALLLDPDAPASCCLRPARMRARLPSLNAVSSPRASLLLRVRLGVHCSNSDRRPDGRLVNRRGVQVPGQYRRRVCRHDCNALPVRAVHFVFRSCDPR